MQGILDGSWVPRLNRHRGAALTYAAAAKALVDRGANVEEREEDFNETLLMSEDGTWCPESS